ncbi:MAG: DUF4168 domain-containing protein [Leptolyngbya sp. RL_3_1]|nr:DUF4168 domain-containing protein [Leptolyngbya sp. RL_3_1]
MCLGNRHLFAGSGRWRSLGLAGLIVAWFAGLGTPMDIGNGLREQSLQGMGTGPLALAQTAISAPEIDQYANAILQMEPARNEAYTEIANLLLAANIDLNQVTLGCANSDLSAVPRGLRQEVDEIRVGYCNQARDRVDQNGLTAQRFNEITIAHREDAALGDRIRQALIRLQQD